MDVHLDFSPGLWRDYCKSGLWGWQWTVTSSQSGVLIAILATVTTLTATRSWKVVRFAIHQSRRHDKSRSAMVREQEVYIRSAETDLGSFWQMVSVLQNWRGFGLLLPRPLIRDLVQEARVSTWKILLFALAHFFLWTYLAVQIPDMLSTQNPLIPVTSDSCGIWIHKAPEKWNPVVAASIAATMATRDARLASEAARRYNLCYRNTSIADCARLVTSKISWHETDAECPFAAGVCLPGHSAISMETGKLSPADFGVNHPEHQNVAINKKLTCAPLAWSQFMFNTSGGLGVVFNLTNHSYMSKANGDRNPKDYFFLHFYPPLHNTYYVQKIHHSVWTEIDKNKALQKELHPALRRTDGDVSIFVIQKKGVMFFHPNDDPVFAAHTPSKGSSRIANWMALYEADEDFGMIGCVDQFRFSNQLYSFDSPWLSLRIPQDMYADEFEAKAGLNDVALYLDYVIRDTGLEMLPYAWEDFGQLLESSSTSAYPQFTAALPPDQWKNEVRRWFGIGLASAQFRSISATADLAPLSETASMHNVLNDPSLRNSGLRNIFCHGVKVYSTSHVSFGVAGLLIYVILTLAIWAISSGDDIYRRYMFRRRPHATLAWYLDDPMQLLRQIHDLQARIIHASENVHAAFRTLGVPTAQRYHGTGLLARYEVISQVQSQEFVRLAQEMTGAHPL